MELRVKASFPKSMKIDIENAYLDEEEKLCKDDNINVRIGEDEEAFGKIHSIYLDCISSRVNLRIFWYYRPEDTENALIISSCSKIELFLSDDLVDIELECVNGKVQILDLDSILQMDEWEEDIYFTRAQWNHKEKRLYPPMNLWKTDCLCNSILNPDIPFKVCTNCKRFLHVKCLENTGSESCPGCGEDLSENPS